MGEPPFPMRAEHPEFGLLLLAHGGAFAGSRIDIGTRVLLEVLAERATGLPTEETSTPTVVDLGCGTGGRGIRARRCSRTASPTGSR